MKKYGCSICGYVYDEAAGCPEAGIVPGTIWDDIPEEWGCPICGASKDDFKEQITGDAHNPAGESIREIRGHEIRELNFGEMSALFSNLAKGCEKQYRPEEAELFGKLAEYYIGKSNPVLENQFLDLSALLQGDLISSYPGANALAADAADRGALRALVWGEKVTKMLSSILSRYEKQQNAFLENTKVFVCKICGFIYIGDEAPEICPVCKVPKMKIKQIQRGV